MEKNITLDKLRLKKDTIELVASQMYENVTELFNPSFTKGGEGSRAEPPKGFSLITFEKI